LRTCVSEEGKKGGGNDHPHEAKKTLKGDPAQVPKIETAPVPAPQAGKKLAKYRKKKGETSEKIKIPLLAPCQKEKNKNVPSRTSREKGGGISPLKEKNAIAERRGKGKT